MNRQLSLIIITLTIFLVAVTVNAQVIPLSVNGLELTPSIDNPVPGQKVTITAKSYNTDINSATITWTVDGKTTSSGIGVTTLDVLAPSLGEKKNVNVTARTGNGLSLSNSITIKSGSVDIIVETDGYAPPSYSGKVPVVYENALKITAIPHLIDSSGSEASAGDLIYKWEKSGTNISEQSGYGKQSITLVGGIIPRPYELKVTAYTRDGSAQTSGSVYITPISPWIDLYADDPLYGPLFNRSLYGSTQIGSSKETTIMAVPFGFNKPVNSIGNLNFTWLINNVMQSNLTQNETVTLRAPSDTSGSSDISLSIKNSKQILQSANTSISVNFYKNSEQ